MASAQYFHENYWGYQYWGNHYWNARAALPKSEYFSAVYWGSSHWGISYWGITVPAEAPAGAALSIGTGTVAGVGAALFDSRATAAGVGAMAGVVDSPLEGVASSVAGSTATGVGRSAVPVVAASVGAGVASGVGLGPNSIGAASGTSSAPAVGDTASGRVVLTWTASADPGVTRYYVGWDTVTHVGGVITDYPQRRDVGNVLIYTVTGLVVGRRYYFGVSSAGAGGSVTTPDSFTSLPDEVSAFPSSAEQGIAISAGTGLSAAVGARLIRAVASAAGVGASAAASAYAVARNAASIGTSTANAIGGAVSGTDAVGTADGVGAAVGVGESLANTYASAAGISAAVAESGYIYDVGASASGIAVASAVGESLFSARATSAGTSLVSAVGDALQPSFVGAATSTGSSVAAAEGAFNQWGVGSSSAFALVSGLSLSGITAIGMAAARASASAVGQNGTVTLSGGDFDVICERVWTRLIERGFTAEQIHRLIAAVLAGRVHGAGTGLEHFRSVTDEKERLTVIVDKYGNRTAVTADVD